MCYGFNPDSINREDTTPATLKKREYYLMLDINRLIYTNSPVSSNVRFSQSKFQTILTQAMRIEPNKDRSEEEREQIKEYDD